MKNVKEITGMMVMVDPEGRVILVLGDPPPGKHVSFAMCDRQADNLGQGLLRAAAVVKELGLGCKDDHSQPDAEA